MKNKFKNQLFHLVNEIGYSPNDFKITEFDKRYEDHENDLSIKFRDTPFEFLIREDEDEFDKFDCYFTLYAPLFPYSDNIPESGFETFDFIKNIFKNWLTNHVEKHLNNLEDEPNLWQEYQNGNQSLTIENITFDEQTFFTISERNQVITSINELKLLIFEHITVSETERLIVETRLNYLIENVERLNKFEWKSVLISTIIGICTTLTLDTQKGQMIFEFLKRVFSYFPKLTY